MGVNKKFWFSNISSIENRNFKDSLEKFFKIGINGTTKENIQNSLDARQDIDKPVNVEIKIGEIETELLPGYFELEERINNLKGANQYTNETIAHMQLSLNSKKVGYITYEDNNTKGLEFIKDDDSCSYYAYAYQQGNHYAESVTQLDEAIRGGSHGIGKIASNAVSDIHLMYFSNCDKYNNKLVGGTVCLVEHNYRGKSYRDMGYLTKNIGEPYVNDINHEVFKKDTRGLKIIIPFFKDEFNNEKEIIKSVCSDYFYAIINEQLVVTINDKRIDSKNIDSYIKNADYFEQDYEKIKSEFVVLNYKALMQERHEILKIKDNYRFKCYFYYNENIKKARISIVRRNGMKICDMKVQNYATKPFNALVISENNEFDCFLKKLENQAHNEIDYKSIRDNNFKKQARQILKKLEAKIISIYNEYNNKLHPADGLIDTADLLYTINSSFQNSLSKKTATVYLNVETDKKEISKINMGRNKEKTPSSIAKERKNSIKKINKGSRSGGGNEVDTLRYLIYPENIYRVIVNDIEHFECDLSLIDGIEKYKRCNIVIKVIDGEGKNVGSIHKLENYFIKIEDGNSHKELRVFYDIVRNVKIINKQIKLDFYCSNNYNSLLKYIYYLEV